MATDTNVDLGEIAKFEKLASRWWDPNSEFKPLHDINPLRAGWIDEHAGVMGKSVVDVGCGGGLLCEALAHRGASVTGIDMGEAPLAVAGCISSKVALRWTICRYSRIFGRRTARRVLRRYLP